MPINQTRPDTPLAATPEPMFYKAQDSIKPKTIVVPKTMQEKNDSIRNVREKEKADRIAARAKKEEKSSAFWKKKDSAFVSEAEKRGLTREQYSRQLEKQQRQPDAQLEGMEGIGRKRNNNPPPCKGGKCTGLNKK